MHRVTLLLFSGLVLLIQQLGAQQKAQRSAIEQGVRIAQVGVDVGTRDLLSHANKEKVQAATVPVLLPKVPAALAAMNLIVEKTFYSAAWAVSEDARANIEGSRIAFRYPDFKMHRAEENTRKVRSSSGVVTQSEGIWTVAWNEYGASYVLAIECSNPAVPTCSQEGVVTVANDLRYVGGGENAPSGRSAPQDISPNAAKHVDAQFQYNPPGLLVPGSGQGLPDSTIYAPGIRFPIDQKPAFANSQVWNPGGMNGPANGSQCDPHNYSYPWWDNFCETRAFDTPVCPASTGHQGQDIRPPSCKTDYYPVVAVDDGLVTHIGSFSVVITDSGGTQFHYLHMSSLKITQGQRVTRGQQLGNVSNVFGTSTTTIHLHFEIVQNVDNYGFTHVSPYMSLVTAYEQLP